MPKPPSGQADLQLVNGPAPSPGAKQASQAPAPPASIPAPSFAAAATAAAAVASPSTIPTLERIDSGREAEPSRIVHPHLCRDAVRRTFLQVLAKNFGVHLQGDVATNEISTAKYTIITFLPVNLFEQFLRVANLYFLLTAILQLIPGLSPTSWFTTVAPLVFVLAVNAVKEGYDDVNRHRNDKQINYRQVLHVTKSGESLVAWRDVVAGDILKVREGEEVPADIVLLSTPDPDNLCYVETANLDGETNLKIKYGWSGGAGKESPKELEEFAENNEIACEAPNPRLYVFDGFMRRISDGSKQPLDTNNLLLRGCTLRKTPWVIGVAVNVGSDAKIVQNMTKAPRKVTQLEKHMNHLVMVWFGVLLVLSAVMAGLDYWWGVRHGEGKDWYLRSTGLYPELPPGVANYFIMLLRFIILFSNLIPISLYVTLEVVKVFQCALLFNQDRAMYHAESDTPFVCRTTALNEELGQVQYVLSDKTGTLTQNIMGFVWASVGGVLYGHTNNQDGTRWQEVAGGEKTPHTISLDQDIVAALGLQGGPCSPELEYFFVNLAVCNTVVPSRDAATGQLQYQASSPDEEALVQGAADLGFKLLNRTTEYVEIQVSGEKQPRIYDVLAVLEFSSDRKRMSIITRGRHDGRVLLMSKGADSIMLARAAKGQEIEQSIREHLDTMARAGLRTLVTAQRELDPETYDAWAAEFGAAQVALENREAKVDTASDKIEQQLELLGATAVEDKLQDGVPECLQALGKAGIKVWVLTGDKVETAISIAYSCKLFDEHMEVVEFREADFKQPGVGSKAEVIIAKHMLVAQLNAQMGLEGSHTNVGMVIEGGALGVCLRPELQDEFMSLCKDCRAVVCCRVSPMQKAQVTHMVKKKAGAITLGIGDGANDVGMIRAAHIGVGISGREGRAAVLSSDFSFAQFKFLSRLLLLHGRWSYQRNEEVVMYSFYKNWVYVLVYIYLQCVAGFSAQPIFTTMLISTFNMIFTAMPIVAYAVLEQDLHMATILANPQTYYSTRCESGFRFFRKFAIYILLGAWHSLPIFFISWYTLTPPGPQGLAQDLSGVGTSVWMALVLVVTLRLSLQTHFWSWVSHLCYWLSVLLMFPFIYVLGSLWVSGGVSGVADMTGVGDSLWTHPQFWLGAMLLTPAMALLPDLVLLTFMRLLRPSAEVLLQEMEYKERMQRSVSKMEAGRNPMAQPTVHVTGGPGARSSRSSGGGHAIGGHWGSGRHQRSSSLLPTIAG